MDRITAHCHLIDDARFLIDPRSAEFVMYPYDAPVSPVFSQTFVPHPLKLFKESMSSFQPIADRSVMLYPAAEHGCERDTAYERPP